MEILFYIKNNKKEVLENEDSKDSEFGEKNYYTLDMYAINF
jgi:hypothetical protein